MIRKNRSLMKENVPLQSYKKYQALFPSPSSKKYDYSHQLHPISTYPYDHNQVMQDKSLENYKNTNNFQSGKQNHNQTSLIRSRKFSMPHQGKALQYTTIDKNNSQYSLRRQYPYQQLSFIPNADNKNLSKQYSFANITSKNMQNFTTNEFNSQPHQQIAQSSCLQKQYEELWQQNHQNINMNLPIHTLDVQNISLQPRIQRSIGKIYERESTKISNQEVNAIIQRQREERNKMNKNSRTSTLHQSSQKINQQYSTYNISSSNLNSRHVSPIHMRQVSTERSSQQLKEKLKQIDEFNDKINKKISTIMEWFQEIKTK